jgi:hypothetical protein
MVRVKRTMLIFLKYVYYTILDNCSSLNVFNINSFYVLYYTHRLNMELDLQSLFWLLCTAVLIG